MSKKANIAIVLGAFLIGFITYLPFGLGGAIPIDTRDCTICHIDMLDAHVFVGDDCAVCHVGREATLRAGACATCHVGPAKIMAEHGRGHTALACTACHPAEKHPYIRTCEACHGVPHFPGVACVACHGGAHRLE